MSAPAPGSPEWQRTITASKVAAILGLSPFDSPYSTWQAMKGHHVKPQTDAMRRGHYHEGGVLAWARDQHPELSEWREQEWCVLDGWFAATCDAVALDEAGELVVIEVKTVARIDDWDNDAGGTSVDGVALYYWVQVQAQMIAAGAKRAIVAILGPYLEHREYAVALDEDNAPGLLAACRRFYDSLAADEPPALDSHPATFATVKALHPDIDKGATVDMAPEDAREYVGACLDLKAAEERERAAKTALLDHMGRAQYADCDGQRIARRQPARHGVSLVRVAKSITATEGEAA